MTEDDVKSILLALLGPIGSSLPPDADVIGWRHPTGTTGTGASDANDANVDQYKLPVCSWTGVTCDPIDDSVIGLNLGNGFYTKTLLGLTDDVVGEDRDARVLAPVVDLMILNKTRRRESTLPTEYNRRVSEVLSPSSIYPSFPSALGQLQSLRFINLSSNRLQGVLPTSVLQLPKLEILDISSNDLEGTFPHIESGALRVLDISKNRFQGPLDEHLFGHPDVGPNTATYLMSLVKFDISHNGFNGTIPLDGTSGYYNANTKRDESLQNLQYFDLGNNLFTGTISNNFGNLDALQGLFLEHNRLVGTIPKSLFESNPLPLVQLFLQQNSLSGTLSEDLAKLPNLKELYVDGNKFTGSIPQSLCSSKLNTAFVNNTQHSSACDDISCPANSASREGVYPCTPCPDDGGYHRYIGQHDSICRERMSEVEILDLFYDSLNGDEWFNASYFWTKGEPACEREGVECNAEGQVTKIVLPSLGLRGHITPQLGSLSELQVLNLSNNHLTGFLPSDLRFPPLTILDVRGSRLQGVVPPLLCLKDGVNGNGILDSYACENVVCPSGTYSQIGRAALPQNDGDIAIQCLPCYDDHARFYMGSDHCTDVFIAGLQIRRSEVRQGLIILIPLILAMLTIIVFVKRRRKQHSSSASSVDDMSHGDDENHENEYDSDDLALRARLSSLSIEADDDWTAADSEGEDSRPMNRTQPLPGRKARSPYII